MTDAWVLNASPLILYAKINDLKYLSHLVYAHLGQKMACSVVLPPQADCFSSFLLERMKENNKIL